jgi:thiol-disulfide isomerase/thioredoxin
LSQTTPEQPDAHPAEQSHAPKPGGGSTTTRVLLAALVFIGLALALSSSHCGPTDDTADAPRANANKSNANGIIRPRGTPSGEATPVSLPDEIKSAELRALDGTGFRLADYQGKVLIINLWATWCPPCRAEIPQIVELYDDYRGRDVEILGLTLEDDRGNTPEAVKQFVSDYRIKYRIAWAEQDLYARFLAPGYQIPQTYVIDRQGRIRKKFVGGGGHIGDFIRGVLDDILAEKQG